MTSNGRAAGGAAAAGSVSPGAERADAGAVPQDGRTPDPERGPRFKLLVAGVGGQGVLTVARLVGAAAMACGLEAVLGQLHGMSQRGGSVVSTVLIGAGQSSFIGAGEADAVVGLEPLEALRAADAMSRCTAVVTSTGTIVPAPLAQAGDDYPDLGWIIEQIAARAGRVVTLDGPALGRAAGAPRTLNIVMLGALSGARVLPEAMPDEALLEALAMQTPPRFRASNERAFALGREAVDA